MGTDSLFAGMGGGQFEAITFNPDNGNLVLGTDTGGTVRTSDPRMVVVRTPPTDAQAAQQSLKRRFAFVYPPFACPCSVPTSRLAIWKR